jgi:hypothetical protein
MTQHDRHIGRLFSLDYDISIDKPTGVGGAARFLGINPMQGETKTSPKIRVKWQF